LIGFRFKQKPIIQLLQAKDFHRDRQPSSEMQVWSMIALPRDYVHYQSPFLLSEHVIW
jgi:hypothetical protein